MTMDCSTARFHLFRLDEGVSSPELQAALREHLDVCPGCARIRAGCLELERTIGERKAVRPDPFSGTRLLARLDREFGAEKKPAARLWTQALRPAGLALALTLGIFLGIYQARRDTMPGNPEIRAQENLESLRSDLFISQFADEDNLLVLIK